MSEPSDLAAASRAGSSQGREGVVALSCARAGAGPSDGTSGATSDSARPSNAAAGLAIFGTLNSILPALRSTSAHFKFDAFAGRAGATFLARSARRKRPRGIRSTFPPVGLRADGAYLMPDI